MIKFVQETLDQATYLPIQSLPPSSEFLKEFGMVYNCLMER